MILKFKILNILIIVFYYFSSNLTFGQCDFQPGNPSGGTETVCFYDENDSLLGCSYNCQVTGQQIKCGYKAGEEPWPDYVKVTFSSFFCFSPSAANPLPVILSNFSLEISNNGVLVEWSTLSEHKCSHFEVQKSYDGLSFETVAILNSTGESQEEINYRYMDFNIHSSMVYYRLKQYDTDGNYTYHKTLAINYIPTSKLELISHNDEYFEIITNKKISEIVLIAIDGTKQPVVLEEYNLIKKSYFYNNLSIFEVIYEDKTNYFKRISMVNY